MHAQPLASQGSKRSSSDDDGDLSDSNPDVSSDDDGCLSEAEKQDGLSVRMNLPWDRVDEQRLVAWKKEALKHASSQKRVSFLPQVDREQLKLCVPTCLLERISNEDLIRRSASPNAGARTVEGSGVQSEANEGVRCMGGI
ncbi:hypothetical protein HOY82DRAFT_608273 [Tuber indicum]|nr:hypothetical protein HOY82DRAFT_608273 [Tuber indicum]